MLSCHIYPPDHQLRAFFCKHRHRGYVGAGDLNVPHPHGPIRGVGCVPLDQLGRLTRRRDPNLPWVDGESAAGGLEQRLFAYPHDRLRTSLVGLLLHVRCDRVEAQEFRGITTLDIHTDRADCRKSNDGHIRCVADAHVRDGDSGNGSEYRATVLCASARSTVIDNAAPMTGLSHCPQPFIANEVSSELPADTRCPKEDYRHRKVAVSGHSPARPGLSSFVLS